MKRYPALLITTVVFLTTLGGASYRKSLLPDNAYTIEQEEVTSQPINREFVRVLDLTLDSNTLYQQIDLDFPFTSFVFEVNFRTEFVNAYFKTEQNDVFKLDSLPATDQPGSRRLSPFIIPDSIQNTFTFYSGKVHGKLRLYLFFAPLIECPDNAHHSKADDWCTKPELVSGKIWREGLPEPTGERERNDVAHNIVHHAATSNSNHDYINVVRNIYLLHTQTNGWDDIGYNFVIAQDGTIFEGRDHQNMDSTDNIKGAHFCGKNSGTMGVCMLGNYQEISPTKAAVNALRHILTWKCYKDGITPLGESPHPSGTSPKLKHIAGHRDGCATACPGDSLYTLLPQIRQETDSLVKSCLPDYIAQHEEVLKKVIWYQKETDGNLIVKLPSSDNIAWVELTDITGKSIKRMAVKPFTPGMSMGHYQPGGYTLIITFHDKVQLSKKIQLF